MTNVANYLSSNLASGEYRLTGTIDAFVDQGAGTMAVTVSNGMHLRSIDEVFFPVEGSSDQNIGAVTDGGAGWLYIDRKVR